MRRALEEDQYSALGSIVETDSSDDDEEYAYDPTSGRSGAIDRHVLQAAVRRHLRMDGQRSLKGFDPATFRMDADDYAEGRARASSPGKRPRGAVTSPAPEEDGRRRKKRGTGVGSPVPPAEEAEESNDAAAGGGNPPPAAAQQQPTQVAAASASGAEQQQGEEYCGDDNDGLGEEEETSIFGATQGAKNATWVECDRCKKVRFHGWGLWVVLFSRAADPIGVT